VRLQAFSVLRFLPFVTLGLVIALLTQLPMTNDAAWQIWVGRQILGGSKLYSDIIEINPPLWFWIGALISPFGWTGLLIFFGLSAALSITLIQRLYQFRWLPYALIFGFFLTGISATGQREQFTLIAVTPYIFLTAARAEGRHPPLAFALAIGLWAALGFALKHYFALVPLALQGWLLVRRRTIAPEFVAVCLVGAGYLGAMVLLTPDYLTEIVPIVREAYRYYDQTLGWFLTDKVVLIGAVASVGFCIARQRETLVQALAISAALFLGIYVGQLKGFAYQSVPALGLLSIMSLAQLFLLDLTGLRNKVGAAIVAFVPIYTVVFSEVVPYKSPTAEYLCTLRPGTKVLALAVNGGHAWPAVEICALEWSSRQMILWTLPSPKLDQVTREEILYSLATKPEVVVIDKKPTRASPYKFVMSDKRILAALKPYRQVLANENFVALELEPARLERWSARCSLSR
jgi:hypothetical protein